MKGQGDESVGAARAGQGLLVGLLRCGRCGRKFHVRYWGKRGTAAKYLCKGDSEGGGTSSCWGFGGRRVDERFAQELMAVLSPLGVRASLVAIDRLTARDDDQRRALVRKLEQCQYEATRAFEQYNEVDPRHRLVAGELERRWNGKREEVDQIKSALAELAAATEVLGDRERERILDLGTRFREVWESEHCPTELKKRLIRAVIEEVVADHDPAGNLRFVIHWKGGTHTQLEMARPPSGREQKTAAEDLEIIRHMAARFGDQDIALVRQRLGRRTGKGKRWSAPRVADARNTYSIPGHTQPVVNPEILTLG